MRRPAGHEHLVQRAVRFIVHRVVVLQVERVEARLVEPVAGIFLRERVAEFRPEVLSVATRSLMADFNRALLDVDVIAWLPAAPPSLARFLAPIFLGMPKRNMQVFAEAKFRERRVLPRPFEVERPRIRRRLAFRIALSRASRLRLAPVKDRSQVQAETSSAAPSLSCSFPTLPLNPVKSILARFVTSPTSWTSVMNRHRIPRRLHQDERIAPSTKRLLLMASAEYQT